VEASAATVPVAGAEAQHGAALFETLAVRDGRCLDLDAHLDRLARGVERLGFGDAPRDRWGATLEAAARERPDGPGWLKLWVGAEGAWFVYGGDSDPDEEGRPVSAVVLPWRRGPSGPSAGLKHIAYLDHREGLRYARGRGADEGLWLNHRGRFVEGCWSNLFTLKRGRLWTPGTCEGGLPGVVRARVLEAASKLGVPVHRGPLKLPRLLAADRVFVTSSLRGLCLVHTLDGRELRRGRGGALLARLAEAAGRRHPVEPGATFP
jgi:branched-subunit amino acid aminotransferase/4-amino-4-deoxychorismate lyase